ncbi:MAG: hypothetical protein ACTHM9_10275 [Gemmatimonadales bacterium]
MMPVRAGRVRTPFRWLAWILGPVLIAAGALMIFLDLRGRTASGWPVWSREAHTGFWLGIGNFILGWILLAAARTGQDPYVPDQGREPTSEE